MKNRATSATRSSSREDAVSLLMQDHKQVQKVFRDFQKAHDSNDDETAWQIAQRACAELEVHTTLEEELFYPAAAGARGNQAPSTTTPSSGKPACPGWPPRPPRK